MQIPQYKTAQTDPYLCCFSMSWSQLISYIQLHLNVSKLFFYLSKKTQNYIRLMNFHLPFHHSDLHDLPYISKLQLNSQNF